MTILVTGAGGFIGGHLVRSLLMDGNDVRAVDRKPLHEWQRRFPQAASWQLDLADPVAARDAVVGCDYVFNLAADMGGMGFIERHKADCMMSVLISTNVLAAAAQFGVRRYFYSSSACVYAADKQADPDVTALKESDAYPAAAEDGYGWEKLFSERMCRHYREDFGLDCRIARFHNVYGPCFDEATEVLTADGWRRFSELADDDSIASLDPVSGLVEYLRPVARQAYHYAGPMYRVESARADQLVTPDHNVYAASHDGVFRLRPARDWKWDAARMSFTSHGTWMGNAMDVVVLPGVTYSDGVRRKPEITVDAKVWFEFAGWFIAEGCAFTTPRNYTVSISQNPGPKQDRILELVRAAGFVAHVNGGKNIVVSSKVLHAAMQQFGSGARGKTIPRWMLDAERPLLEALYAGLMGGDGDSDGGRYSTASKSLADDVQELALRLERRASVRVDGDLWRVHMSDRTSTETRASSRRIEHYDGMVYDVTLPRHHILMVRRNGKPCWSGNCGTWKGGREKAPAAICRKVIEAVQSGSKQIEIWGDGEQTRSFMYVDDCIEGVMRIMDSDVVEPLNLGSSELVSINDLVTLVEGFADVTLERRYNLDAPQGVRGRNSSNELILERLDWEPSTPLAVGMERTYQWILAEMGVGHG